MLFPERDAQIAERNSGIRMPGDGLIELDGHAGDSVSKGESDSDGALMEIGASVGLFRRQTDHRHHGIAPEDDHTDIGDTLITVIPENIGEVDALFQKRVIDLSAKAVKSAEDIGDDAVDLNAVQQGSIVFLEGVPRMAADHQDAAAAAAVTGLDDKAAGALV